VGFKKKQIRVVLGVLGVNSANSAVNVLQFRFGQVVTRKGSEQSLGKRYHTSESYKCSPEPLSRVSYLQR